MDGIKKKFTGIDGVLIVDGAGVTIERSSLQALARGSKRETSLRYQDIAEVRYRTASIRPGTIQFVVKQGVEGMTPLDRVMKLDFSREESHRFRRARAIIESAIMPYVDLKPSEISAEGDGDENELNSSDSRSSIPSGGLPFRRLI